VLIYRGRSACCFALSARKTVNISTAGQSSSPFGKRVWGCEIPQKGSDFFFCKNTLVYRKLGSSQLQWNKQLLKISDHQKSGHKSNNSLLSNQQ
jgi:hypothetical protein